MTNYFAEKGRALLANGYRIVPIHPGQKSPAMTGWESSQLGVADLSRWQGCGVGVICGVGAVPVVGIDIDITHPEINAALVAWCEANLGSGCSRIGAAPKTLFAYRASQAGWSKAFSSRFTDGTGKQQGVEILGFGQQFVAYHIHPDTSLPYVWTDVWGGLEEVPAVDLPMITEGQVDELFLYLSTLLKRTSGLTITRKDATTVTTLDAGNELLGLVAKAGLSIEAAAALIGKLQADDHDYWFRVGMALHHEFDGSEEAWQVFDAWSRTSPESYNERENRKRWDSFGKRADRQPVTMGWVKKIADQAVTDAEIAARRAAIETIRAELETATDSTDLTTRVAKRVRDLMPEESAARTEVVGIFQQKFKSLSRTPLPVGEARKLLLNDGVPMLPPGKFQLTEFGNTDRLVARYGKSLMYVPETDMWHAWNGVYWRGCTKTEIELYAKETIRSMIKEADDHDHSPEFYDFLNLSQRARMVSAMVQLAASEPSICTPASELDKHTHLLGVQNGVVDLRTGELLPPDPSYRITMVCGCEYRPDAMAPLFMQTVLDVFYGKREDAEMFMSLIGYAAMGDPKEDILVIPYGNGANGKSTLLGVIREAFGGYARSADSSSFVSDPRQSSGASAGGAREDLVRLRGARFIYVNEPDENSELREGAVKAMSGGDAITARGLFARKSIEVIPTWTAFMPTNHKPVIKGSDNGIWRRIVPVPFLRNFKAEGQSEDKDRSEKLRQELPGVLTAIVRAALRYQQRGLAISETVETARDAYRSQMDVLAEWIESQCEIGPQFEEETHALWKSWDAFARERGITSIKNAVSFGRRLENRFPSRKMSGGKRMRLGVRLRGHSFDAGDVSINDLFG